MLTQQEIIRSNKARAAAQATAENLKYQARRNAANASKVPDKLAKYLKTQRPAKG